MNLHRPLRLVAALGVTLGVLSGSVAAAQQYPPTTNPPTTSTTTTTTTTLPPPTTAPPPPTTAPPPTTRPPATTTTTTTSTTTTSTVPATSTTTTVPATSTTTTTIPALPPTGGQVTVGDGNITVTKPPEEEGGGLVNVTAENLAPGSTLRVEIRVTQRLGDVTTEQPLAETDPQELAPQVVTLPDDGQDTELGLLPTLDGVDPDYIGSHTRGVTIVNADPDDEDAVEELRDEVLGTLSETVEPFPQLEPDDELLTEATSWMILDIVVNNAVPGEDINTVWFSDPLLLATTQAGRDGTAAFQVAVPDTAIIPGEQDILRVFATYDVGATVVGDDGTAGLDIELDPRILEVAEPGSIATLVTKGEGVDGAPVLGEIDVPIDSLVLGADAADDESDFPWFLLVLLLILILLIIILLAARRYQKEQQRRAEERETAAAAGLLDRNGPTPPAAQ